MSKRKLYFGAKGRSASLDEVERIASAAAVGERVSDNAVLETDRLSPDPGSYEILMLAANDPKKPVCPQGVRDVYPFRMRGKILPRTYRETNIWYWSEHTRGSLTDYILWCPVLVTPPVVGTHIALGPTGLASVAMRPIHNARFNRVDFTPEPNVIYSSGPYF